MCLRYACQRVLKIVRILVGKEFFQRVFKNFIAIAIFSQTFLRASQDSVQRAVNVNAIHIPARNNTPGKLNCHVLCKLGF